MRQGTKPLRAGSKLDVPTIVDAAFDVLEEYGFDGLGLRLVADRLDVQTPALYWHVRNKAMLISLMARSISESAAHAKVEGRGWRDKLTFQARWHRREMLKHRDSARLMLAAQPLEDPESVAQRLAAPLMESGLSARVALSYYASVVAFAMGWVAYEQSQALHDFLTHMIDFEESFEVGLQAIVAGFAAP
jgi:TetR/AcrR family transcriptional regulator, tetracycline repressor protein